MALRTFRFAAATLLSVAASSAVAQPRKWWVLNFTDAKCQSASEVEAPTPEMWRDVMWRRYNILATPQVKHLEDGELYYVLLSFHAYGRDWETAWFPKEEFCQFALDKGKANGAIPNPADLK